MEKWERDFLWRDFSYGTMFSHFNFPLGTLSTVIPRYKETKSQTNLVVIRYHFFIIIILLF